MTSNEERATTLVKALRAGVEGDKAALGAMLTDDVRAWTPALSTSSLTDIGLPPMQMFFLQSPVICMLPLSGVPSAVLAMPQTPLVQVRW